MGVTNEDAVVGGYFVIPLNIGAISLSQTGIVRMTAPCALAIRNVEMHLDSHAITTITAVAGPQIMVRVGTAETAVLSAALAIQCSLTTGTGFNLSAATSTISSASVAAGETILVDLTVGPAIVNQQMTVLLTCQNLGTVGTVPGL